MKFVAGIDGGGTKTIVRCEGLEEEAVAIQTFGPFNYNSIGADAFSALLGQILAFLGEQGSCQALCVGAAGHSNSDMRKLVEAAVIQAGIPNWRLVGDHEIALRGALAGRPGCVVVAGTGSICCGINGSGELIRVGGWGHSIGDEGSGYAVGRDALTAVARRIDGCGQETILTELLKNHFGLGSREEIIRYAYGGNKHRIAAIAPVVEEAAEKADEAAWQILRDNAGRLSDMVRTATGRLGMTAGEAALTGGMLEQCALYRRAAVEAIEKAVPGFRCIAPRRTAAEGAVMLAKELLGQRPAAFLQAVSDGVPKSYPEARLGVDIGGTSIKFAVLHNGDIVYKSKIKTAETDEGILKDIIEECRRLKKKYNVKAAGIGTPGSFRNGQVFASNLPFNGIPLEKILNERLGIPTVVDNDANCAALGEMVFGGARDCGSIVLITLGTGIGGGVIINRQICRGKGRMGEIGHMIVQMQDGRKCPCGNTGCWERYASSAALIRQAEKAARENAESILSDIYRQNGGHLKGEDIFEALELGCRTAGEVFAAYISSLAAGIESLNNILDPDAFILAGGITAQGDKLLLPLKEKLNAGIRVEISSLQSDAGVLGAAMLE